MSRSISFMKHDMSEIPRYDSASCSSLYGLSMGHISTSLRDAGRIPWLLQSFITDNRRILASRGRRDIMLFVIESLPGAVDGDFFITLSSSMIVNGVDII